jgi:hypothetical protein
VHQGCYAIGLIDVAVCDDTIAPGHAEIGQNLAEAVGDEDGVGRGDAGCAVRGIGESR